LAASALSSLMLLGTPANSTAQSAGRTAQPVGRVAGITPGSINGTVRDETGAPIWGAVVSAVGTATIVDVTDRDGRFQLRSLSPGP
jgi:protocatechuate 3,4-dioxygenase beta subunit